MMISKSRIIESEVVNIFNALGMMVAFKCQPDWTTGFLDEILFLGMSVKVFLDERISI